MQRSSLIYDDTQSSPDSETSDAAVHVPTIVICEDCVALTAWVTSKPPAGDVHQIHKDGASWLSTIKTCQGCLRLGYFLPLECENVTRCDVTIQRDVFDKIAALDLEFRRDPEIWLTRRIYVWADEGVSSFKRESRKGHLADTVSQAA